MNQPEAEKEEPRAEIAPPPVRKERKTAPTKNQESAPEPAPAKPPPAKKDKFVQARQEVMQFEPVTRGALKRASRRSWKARTSTCRPICARTCG